MDEMTFLRDLAGAEADIGSGGVHDVRQAVWERLSREASITPEPAGMLGCWLFRLDMAAVAAIAIGAGLLYSCTKDVMADMYWSGSLYDLCNYF